MKKIKIILLFFIILAGILFFRDEIMDLYSGLSIRLPKVEKEIGNLLTQEAERKIFTPPPLRASQEHPDALLTQAGVIRWTNTQREKYGLSPLQENSKLNESAQIKIDDMFKNQYFAHISPLGEGVTYLAKEVGYEFIAIGENLALGNFQNDEALVQAWMDSSGHRENILNSQYQEIGIAAKKGVFEGKYVWMAVQHFGLPISVCPQINEKLKAEIDANQNELQNLQETINALAAEIKVTRPKHGSGYNRKIEQYNIFVSQYNELVAKTEILINQYNNQIRVFNNCVAVIK